MLIGGSNVSHAMQIKEPFIVGDTLRIPFTTKNNRMSLYEFKLPYKKDSTGYLCMCYPVITSKLQKPHHSPKKMSVSEVTLCKLLSMKKAKPNENLVETFIQKVRMSNTRNPRL